MHRLSVKLLLDSGQLSFDAVHLQRGLIWARRRDVLSVRGRKVQGINRSSSVHGMRRRDLFYNRGLDMHCLSFKLLLACGELSFDELLLQRGLIWACWRRLHNLCGRKVQGINRISPVQRLSVKL
jgi:hypothetical protein